MSMEASWRLGPGARRRIVEAVGAGVTQKRAAARFCVSLATVNLWVRRAREATLEELGSGAWAQDRCSRPGHSPSMISEAEQDRICEMREHTDWGPRLIAPHVGRPHSTVHAALRRRGCSRKPAAPRENVVRYEWPCPGQLLHVDVKKFGRFQAPGHKVTGDRNQRSRRVGWDYAHTLIDDCSRLACGRASRTREQTWAESARAPGATAATPTQKRPRALPASLTAPALSAAPRVPALLGTLTLRVRPRRSSWMRFVRAMSSCCPLRLPRGQSRDRRWH